MGRLSAAVAVGVALATASPARASDDPAFSQQWALAQIGAPAAWASTTGAGVTIGIVDTGVDLGHEDLGGRVVAHTNCIGTSGDPSRCAGSGQDDHGHGTHVAGIAAAVKDNRRGVAGVAPDARLVVAKVLAADGSGKTSDATAGIKWVVDHGAQVVNLSFGDDGLIALSGTSLREGVDYAWSHGAVPVLASGNSNALGLGLLGGADYAGLRAVAVGATTPTGQMASYSSPLRTAAWSVVAPGGSGTGSTAQGIVSTWRSNQYAVLAGTSMAAPHVAGGLALLLSQGLGRDQAVHRLLDTADPSVRCDGSCRGRIDLARAVGPGAARAARDPGPAAATPTTGRARSAVPTTTGAPAPPSSAAPMVTAPAPGPQAGTEEAASLAGDDPSSPSVLVPGLVAAALAVCVAAATAQEAWRRRSLLGW